MVRLFRLMLFVMLAAAGVDSNDEIAALRDLKPPDIASNVLHSVMTPPPTWWEDLRSVPVPVESKVEVSKGALPVFTGDVST
jgi:hypothetical protein